MAPPSSASAISDDSLIPRHVAIIMDGNGRWATQRFMPRVAGHAKGVDAVSNIVQACLARGVKYLTLFAFSSENWRRPPEEVSLLMRLFMNVLECEVTRMHASNICVKVVGDMNRFDARLQELIIQAEQRTAGNTGLTVTICANYGGRWDIMQAVNKMVSLNPGRNSFAEAELAPHLSMAYAPEPDLVIRTGGEKRMSNFMLWELVYAELYFTDTYWPDFDGQALDLAFESYCQRERRFGRTGQQLTNAQ